MGDEAKEAVRSYTKIGLPICGTYKMYSSKNTNAGLDWSYVQISPDFSLYYAKQELVGFIYNEKCIVAIPYHVRDSWTVKRMIKNHMLRVIASKHDLTLDDQMEMSIAESAWAVSQHIYTEKLPYLLHEAMNRGGLTEEMIKEVNSADWKQFDKAS